MYFGVTQHGQAAVILDYKDILGVFSGLNGVTNILEYKSLVNNIIA